MLAKEKAMDRYEAIVRTIEDLKEALGKAGFHLEVGIGAKPEEKPVKWDYKFNGEDYQIFIDNSASPDIMNRGVGFMYNEHDARKATAAPELLEAAKEVSWDWHSDDSWDADACITKLDEAIAKAEGKDKGESSEHDGELLEIVGAILKHSDINGRIIYDSSADEIDEPNQSVLKLHDIYKRIKGISEENTKEKATND